MNNAKHKLSQNFDNHGGAFLVGRISGVAKALESNFKNRWIIEFDEYAEINIPKIWEGWRNPVIYLKTVSLNTVGAIAGKLNIDFDNLEFHKVPPRDTQFIVNHMNVENKFFNGVAGSDDDQHVQGREMNAPHELSIEEAKIGLSNKYDVPIDNIEITLRG